MTKTREQRRNQLAIPEKFVPQFWDEIDGRCGVVKEIRRRLAKLVTDTGADSIQKEMLCQRAIFIDVQLETMECMAAESGKFDPGVYAQMVNALSGLLTKLGLNAKNVKPGTLKDYLKDRGK